MPSSTLEEKNIEDEDDESADRPRKKVRNEEEFEDDVATAKAVPEVEFETVVREDGDEANEEDESRKEDEDAASSVDAGVPLAMGAPPAMASMPFPPGSFPTIINGTPPGAPPGTTAPMMVMPSPFVFASPPLPTPGAPGAPSPMPMGGKGMLSPAYAAIAPRPPGQPHPVPIAPHPMSVTSTVPHLAPSATSGGRGAAGTAVSLRPGSPEASLKDVDILDSSPTSPFTQALRLMVPRHRNTIVASENRKDLKWRVDEHGDTKQRSRKTLTEDCAKLERVLHAFARGDMERASGIISILLARHGNKILRKKVFEKLGKDDPFDGDNDNRAADIIANGVRSFLRHHHCKGKRSRAEQDAVDAILTASMFEYDPHISSKARIVRFLGLTSRQTMDLALDRALEMRRNNMHFHPRVQKVRSDCVRDIARDYVDRFCHDDNYTYLRGRAYVYKVKREGTDTVEEHPARYWKESGMEWRYDQFHNSIHFEQFLKDHPGKSIGETTFRNLSCRCVSNPPQIPKLPPNTPPLPSPIDASTAVVLEMKTLEDNANEDTVDDDDEE